MSHPHIFDDEILGMQFSWNCNFLRDEFFKIYSFQESWMVVVVFHIDFFAIGVNDGIAFAEFVVCTGPPGLVLTSYLNFVLISVYYDFWVFVSSSDINSIWNEMVNEQAELEG